MQPVIAERRAEIDRAVATALATAHERLLSCSLDPADIQAQMAAEAARLELWRGIAISALSSA